MPNMDLSSFPASSIHWLRSYSTSRRVGVLTLIVAAGNASSAGHGRLTIVLPLLLVAAGTSAVYVLSKPRSD